MSPIPREISPELVLVDPDLASAARLLLPEPGWLGRQHLSTPKASESPVRSVLPQMSPSKARSGWRVTLLRTAAAVSLTFNGFWLAQMLGRTAPPSVEPLPRLSLAWGSASNDVSPAEAASAATPSSPSSGTGVVPTSRGPVEAAGARPSSLGIIASNVRRGRGRAHSTRHAASVVARTSRARTLQWKAVADASYYNVVLWRDGKRVLDLWPSRPRVVMPRTPVAQGQEARLSTGRYLWFVYPGFGSKASQQYGALVASGVVVVQPKEGNEG